MKTEWIASIKGNKVLLENVSTETGEAVEKYEIDKSQFARWKGMHEIKDEDIVQLREDKPGLDFFDKNLA